MPADYLACVDKYVEKGVSKKTAQTRCAIWFYKKHGYPVKEAHSIEDLPDVDGIDKNEIDFELLHLITSDFDELEKMIPKKGRAAKLTKKDQNEEVELSNRMKSSIIAINTEMLDDFNVLEIVATKVGAKAYTEEGTEVLWTQEGIDSSAGTWALTPLSANHEEDSFYGRILKDEVVDDTLRTVVKVTDYIKEWINVAGHLIGVSIEATDVKIKDFKIMKARGAGLTFVFPPHEPACPIKEGCGIMAEKKDDDVEVEKTTDAGAVSSMPNTAAGGEEYTITGLTQNMWYTVDGSNYVPWNEYPHVDLTDWGKYRIVISPNTLPPSDNNSEESDIDSKPENTGEKMTEAEKKTVCAEMHEKAVSERDSQIEALKKENEALRISLQEFEAKEREAVLKEIEKEGLDPTPYQKDPIAVLEKLLSGVKAFKEKFEAQKIVDSGAVVNATNMETDTDGDAISKAKEQAEKEAEEALKAEEAKLKEIDAKAASYEGTI